MATVVDHGKPLIIKQRLKNRKLGERNIEVRPVGAWVQAEYMHGGSYYEGVHSAQEEERRLLDLKTEKQAKLKRFQDDVRKRVNDIARRRREEQLKKCHEAAEVERSVLTQSGVAAERSTSRKHYQCSVRDQAPLAVRHSAPTIHSHLQGAVIKAAGHDQQQRTHESDDSSYGVLRQAKHEVHTNTTRARHNLIGRRIAAEREAERRRKEEREVQEGLPGGKWEEGERVPIPDSPDSSDLSSAQSTSTSHSYPHHRHDHLTTATSVQPVTKSVQFDLGDLHITDRNADQHEGEESGDDDDDDDDDNREYQHQHNTAFSSRTSTRLPPPLPVLHPTQQTSSEREQAVRQRATYRRLFMDIEREQVKENIRRAKHHKQIAKFKLDKEREREAIEAQCVREIEVTDPVTGDSIADVEEQVVQRQLLLHQQQQHMQRQQQKAKDMHRYLEALRCRLREKVELRGIDLPPLCGCGETVWDSNPQTCANNCVYYKNPKAYAKALQNLLVSCEVI